MSNWEIFGRIVIIVAILALSTLSLGQITASSLSINGMIILASLIGAGAMLAVIIALSKSDI